MFKDKKLILLLVGVMVFSLMLAGCGAGNEGDTSEGEEVAIKAEDTGEDREELEEIEEAEEGEESDQEEISFSEWEGDWVSLVSYIDDEGLIEEFQEEADEHGETIEEYKTEWAEGMKTDYLAIEVEGNMAKFYSDIGKSDLMFESEYVFDGEIEDDHDDHDDHGHHHAHWAVFNARNEESQYPVLLMMEVHGEDKLAHFHMRYGDTVEDALAKDNWLPIIIKADSNISQVKQIVGH